MSCTVNCETPTVVGVPESKPLELKFKPVGNMPVEIVQLSAPTPPFCCSCCVYGTLSNAVGSTVVMEIGTVLAG